MFVSVVKAFVLCVLFGGILDSCIAQQSNSGQCPGCYELTSGGYYCPSVKDGYAAKSADEAAVSFVDMTLDEPEKEDDIFGDADDVGRTLPLPEIPETGHDGKFNIGGSKPKKKKGSCGGKKCKACSQYLIDTIYQGGGLDDHEKNEAYHNIGFGSAERQNYEDCHRRLSPKRQKEIKPNDRRLADLDDGDYDELFQVMKGRKKRPEHYEKGRGIRGRGPASMGKASSTRGKGRNQYGGGSMQSSRGGGSMQSRGGSSMQSSRGGGSMQSSRGGGSMQSSRGGASMQRGRGGNGSRRSQGGMGMQGRQGGSRSHNQGGSHSNRNRNSKTGAGGRGSRGGRGLANGMSSSGRQNRVNNKNRSGNPYRGGSMRSSNRQGGRTRGHKRSRRQTDGKIIGAQYNIYCLERGAVDNGTTLLNLCHICWAWRKLPDKYFPRFHNELVCGGKSDDENTCISGYGNCIQVWRDTEVLEKINGDNIAKDSSGKWETTKIKIGTACSCKAQVGTAVQKLVTQ